MTVARNPWRTARRALAMLASMMIVSGASASPDSVAVKPRAFWKYRLSEKISP